MFDLMIILNPFPLNQIFSITIGGTDVFACKLNFSSQRTDCVTTFIILFVLCSLCTTQFHWSVINSSVWRGKEKTQLTSSVVTYTCSRMLSP